MRSMVDSVVKPRSSARRAHPAIVVPGISRVFGSPMPISMTSPYPRLPLVKLLQVVPVDDAAQLRRVPGIGGVPGLLQPYREQVGVVPGLQRQRVPAVDPQEPVVVLERV